MRSLVAERGFANWPAIRPTLTTGNAAAYVSTTDICSRIRSFSRIVTAEVSWNDSAQSPACRRNARPAATSASESRSARASPAKTSGGMPRSSPRAISARAASGHTGCCSASCSPHDEGVQGVSLTAIRRSVYVRRSFSLAVTRAGVRPLCGARESTGRVELAGVERPEALFGVRAAQPARVVAQRAQAAGQALVAEERRQAAVGRGAAEVQDARMGDRGHLARDDPHENARRPAGCDRLPVERHALAGLDARRGLPCDDAVDRHAPGAHEALDAAARAVAGQRQGA